MKPVARLEDWELIGGCLWGIVFDHPKFSDGEEIKTSRVTEIDPNERFAKTLKTDFELGMQKRKLQ